MRLSDSEIIEIIDAHSEEDLDFLLTYEFWDHHGREPYGSHEFTRWLLDHFRHTTVHALPDHLEIVDGKIVPKQRDGAAT